MCGEARKLPDAVELVSVRMHTAEAISAVVWSWATPNTLLIISICNSHGLPSYCSGKHFLEGLNRSEHRRGGRRRNAEEYVKVGEKGGKRERREGCRMFIYMTLYNLVGPL